MDAKLQEQYLAILKEELIPAMGCTEPIAIAYAAAVAQKHLGKKPGLIEVIASPNISKNAKSVVVPHTGSMRGIESAAIAGCAAGDADLELEVLSHVTEEQIEEMRELKNDCQLMVTPAENKPLFYIEVRVCADDDSAICKIEGSHTNITFIKKNNEVLLENPYVDDSESKKTPREILSVENIVEFADTVELEKIKDLFDQQIKLNLAIAEEGLTGKWGAAVGHVLLTAYGNEVHNKAKAYAAAGSDARMGGCELPVVINSGSGNQGLTTSLPVIIYAKELGVSDELLYRALVVSNLVTIHLKTGVGCLSAYCGATSAGCGAGAGITYLYGGKANAIAHTIVNAVAINSGMICDGAKPSCAAKIASAVEAGLIGMQMQRQGKEFFGGDGIVVKGVENTLKNVARLARRGMLFTDKEIIQMIISK